MKTLKLWFERDLRKIGWPKVEVRVDQSEVAEIRFSTKFFTYTLTADTLHRESFLGGTCFDRIRQTTVDLPESQFKSETWTKIVEAIEELELISCRPRPGRLF